MPTNYKTKSNKPVIPIGYGTMAATDFYTPLPSPEFCAHVFEEVLKKCNFVDTAMIYGNGLSEKILGQLIAKGKREDIFISTKGGVFRQDEKIIVDGRKATLFQNCLDSLQRLNTSYIDVYFLHRVDPTIPLEESLDALIQLKREGKICYIGLSEVDATTVVNANTYLSRFGEKVHFVQNEYSLMSRDPEVDGTLEVCRQLNISFLAYCPLGRGMFSTATAENFKNIGSNDIRRILPRFQSENIENNVSLRKPLEAIASRLSCSVSQLALAWLLAKAEKMQVDIIPIPGTKQLDHFHQNMDTLRLKLSPNIIDELDYYYPPHKFAGIRWPSSIVNKRDEVPRVITSPVTTSFTPLPPPLSFTTEQQLPVISSELIALNQRIAQGGSIYKPIPQPTQDVGNAIPNMALSPPTP